MQHTNKNKFCGLSPWANYTDRPIVDEVNVNLGYQIN
jgi:hypothetical protein